MSDPQQPAPTPAPTGGERRRLDRAPGERYAGGETPRTGVAVDSHVTRGARWIVAAVLVADVAALAFFVLGQLDVAFALVLAAGVGGWATALPLVWHGPGTAIRDRRLRMGVATVLGGWVVVAGCLLSWAFGLMEGGSLGPLEYVVERFGLWAPASLLAASFVAAYRAR